MGRVSLVSCPFWWVGYPEDRVTYPSPQCVYEQVYLVFKMFYSKQTEIF